MQLSLLRAQNFTGKGLKVAIFDSGISQQAQEGMNVVEYIDFTNDGEDNDPKALHGTFMASVIGSTNPECIGIAPEADLYIFKVFNN